MAVSVSLPNARSYQREAIVLLGGGALSGIVAFVLAQVSGSQHIELMALSFGAMVGLLASFADPKEGTPMLRLVLSILGGAVMAIAWSFQPILAGALGGLFIGAGASLGEGKNRIEGAWNWFLYACALALGVFVTQRVGMTVFESSEFGQNLFQGAVWGLFLAFSAGLKRLEFLRDELRSEFAEAEAEVKGVEKDNIIAGRMLYERIVIEIEKKESNLQDRALEIASETSKALIAFSRRSDELRQAAEVTSGRQLKKRILEVDARLLATKDSQVSKELRTVLDELGEQLRVRSRLEVARARLEARQQRCLTSLERLHVTLLQGSGSSSQDSSLQESIESLERLSDELHWQNLSVEELVKDSDADEELTVDQLLQNVRQEPEGVVLSVDTTLDTEEPANEPVASKGADGTDGTVTESEEAHVQTSSH